jgi:ribosome recycling factor
MTPAPAGGLAEHLKHAKQLMDKAVEAVKREFTTVRTGKATTALLDLVRVEAYGKEIPDAGRDVAARPAAQYNRGIRPQSGGEGHLTSDLGSRATTYHAIHCAAHRERAGELVKGHPKFAEEGRVAIRHARTRR